MFDDPSITDRKAQPYVAIKTAVTMDGFDVVEGRDVTNTAHEWR
jgi:hypothetical protein